MPVKGEPLPSAAPTPAPSPPLPDSGSIRVQMADGKATELPLEDYILGVVGAEMPASFHPSALEAQAVAARTYALSCRRSGVHSPEADICADPACCQAYAPVEELSARWGEDGAENLGKLRGAVTATAGLVLEYGGAPIRAVFHASSLGRTAEAGEIWGSGYPYLQSVSTPETVENAPGLESVAEVPLEDFRATVLAAYPQAKLDGSPKNWLGEVKRTPSGRVEEVKIGGVAVTGKELRTLFALRSTDFDIQTGDAAVTFTVHGHGHGVGMSQYGANTMAAQGADFREILGHYYPGAQLKSIGT